MSPLKAHDLSELPIPVGLGVWWMGNTSIPAGWTVDTLAADGRFPKAAPPGWGVNGNGGSNTHTHTLPSHGHNVNGSTGNWNAFQGSTNAKPINRATHTHGSTSGSGGSVGAVASVPYYTDGIPIKYNQSASGAGGPRRHDFAAEALVPYHLIGHWKSDAAVPTGFAKCDGGTVNGVGTPDFRGKYLRGVGGYGVGGATGGSTSHTHQVNHYHISGGASQTISSGNGGEDPYNAQEDHTQTFAEVSQTSDGSSNGHDPEYSTIHYIMFVGYGSNAHAHPLGRLKASDLDSTLMIPRGAVMAQYHNEGVPSGWNHCDGGGWNGGAPSGYGNKPNLLSRIIRHTSAGQGGGALGGADSHVHTSGDNHAHTSGASVNGYYYQYAAGGHSLSWQPHTHTTASTPYTTFGGAVNHNPPYVEVRWLVRD